MTAATMIRHLAATDPAAELFAQALGLQAVTTLTVIVPAAAATAPAYTLLFEVWNADRPARPEKRYLDTLNGSSTVHAMMPHRANQLAALLAHPEIKITVLDAATAIEAYTALEETNPSRETLRNGQPRQYLPPVLD